jgi:release factor glutamine methyltransferase
MTIGDLLRAATTRLSAAGVADARRDARILLAAALGIDMGMLIARDDQSASPEAAQRFDAMIRRREAREPVARILGRRGFWTLDLQVTTDTLDPRPDSETVVEAVLARLSDKTAPYRILDLGTGSGCLLLALLSELPKAWGLGVDRSPGAAAAARANARLNRLDTRTSVMVGDWATSLDARFDVVVANPPYIEQDAIAGLMPEVREYDPVAALDGGLDGLDAYRAILADLPRLLVPGALAAFELGQGQGQAVGAMMGAAGFSRIEIRPDLAGIGRCIIATYGQNHHTQLNGS